jgi:aromatic-amino-acid transaminase
MGGRIDGMQAPGGTGAVRLAVALAKKAGIKRIWMGTPSWPNHAQIAADVGVEIKGFNHATKQGGGHGRAARRHRGRQEGDAIMLHGCCHNPSGIDYTNAQWDEIAGLVKAKGILPILDLAYQGLGQGMEEDAYGIRRVLAAVPEALIAYSCDKNFGYYRDRVGALYVLAAQADQVWPILSNGHALARACWSMPPDHGGAVVRLILEDEALTASWLNELDVMRAHERGARQAGRGRYAGLGGFHPFGTQNGLFSIVPLTGEQVLAMRESTRLYGRLGPHQRGGADDGQHRQVHRCGCGCDQVRSDEAGAIAPLCFPVLFICAGQGTPFPSARVMTLASSLF